ncbi:hypothetical protein N0V93_000825 [Gnomoniopsis smithogilvyi]|uniref:Uncharacterized protein n=1 Tax=Gnomoniopsis smithogilvyi TaxID=1191159 RepID=A0A9W9D1P8_9PEZI|nr:hypothetical protein N0V93_000825 [Gnomoniopsis smithogilvyi]
MSPKGTGPYPVTTLPFGLLPPAFAGDEHVSIAGVADALLPSVSPQFQQQQQWPSTDWGDLSESMVTPPSSDDYWHGLWTASLGRDTSTPSQINSGDCQPGCTIHSGIYHSAELLLGEVIAFPANYVQQWQPEKTDEVLFWLTRQMGLTASSPSMASARLELSFQPTRQDAELLRIFVNFVSRFKATLDGDVDLNTSAYMTRFVPFCLHSPLLIQTAIYTSACFLNEMEGRHNLIDSTTAVAHKFRAIKVLNEHLQTHESTTDEAISAVMQLMLNEWYWGNMDDLEAHTRGLKEMIRLRGGFRSVGLSGLLAKLVIV